MYVDATLMYVCTVGCCRSPWPAANWYKTKNTYYGERRSIPTSRKIVSFLQNIRIMTEYFRERYGPISENYYDLLQNYLVLVGNMQVI